ncbi:hypothetical protein [Candidatus Mesenet endosymbiont of Agriotes lineatus]|uniref:hypothetical protein n=1 Tax=Candidatus Mesenet endosymbiont of Agriotes lineatus TaxID=3077948 RepID=UPI0030CCD120
MATKNMQHNLKVVLSKIDTISFVSMFLITILLPLNFSSQNKVRFWIALFCLKLISNFVWLKFSTDSLRELKHRKNCSEDIKKLKKVRYSVAITCYSVDAIRQFIGLIDILDIGLKLVDYVNPLNGYVIVSFTTKFLKLFMSSSIERYCKCKDYQSSKRGKKEKFLLAISFIMPSLTAIDIIGKMINVTEKYGYFIVEDKIIDCGNSITYTFNFSNMIRLVCMLMMIAGYTLQLTIEKKSSTQVESPDVDCCFIDNPIVE